MAPRPLLHGAATLAATVFASSSAPFAAWTFLAALSSFASAAASSCPAFIFSRAHTGGACVPFTGQTASLGRTWTHSHRGPTDDYASEEENDRFPMDKRARSFSCISTKRRRSILMSAARDSSEESSDCIRVGIAGAGSIAFGMAVLLAESGHNPMLWSPSGKGTADLVASSDCATLTSTGAVEATIEPRIARSAAELARENEVLLIALPANGHMKVMNSLVPHIRPGQHVVISSHASLGAIYLRQLLHDRGISVPVTAWGTTAVTSRKTSGCAVRITTVRKLIDMCTCPEPSKEAGLELCQKLFGDHFKLRDGLLAISLSNLNPQNHMAIALGNMSRMEKSEVWSQGQNITPNVGRLMEALDSERLEIASALGLEVRTIFEHFHLSFHVPVSSISEMNQEIYAIGNDVNGPDTADSRYVTEDVPYGLTLTVALGEIVGKKAMLHESGIRIFSAMYGRDFLSENMLLRALDLKEVSLNDLQEAARTGLLCHSSIVADSG